MDHKMIRRSGREPRQRAPALRRPTRGAGSLMSRQRLPDLVRLARGTGTLVSRQRRMRV